MLRRLCTIAALATLAAALPAAQAQGDPSRPVRIVVPYAVGGGSDILARQLAAGLQQAWGQGVVVENKAGASGNVGTLDVVRAAPDGHTLLVQNSTMVTSLAVSGKLPYDAEKDLTPIMLLGVTPIALAAHPDAGVATVREFVAAARARPDAFSYGSCGIGTPQHFVMELIKQRTATAAAHVGYKGCAPAVTDLLGGHVALASVSANLVAPYARDGRLRVLGVSTAHRYARMPEVPTFEEQGLKPFDFSIWYALMGPARLPAEVVARVAADAAKVLADPAVQASLSGAGVELYKGSAADLARLIKADTARYVQLVKAADIKAD